MIRLKLLKNVILFFWLSVLNLLACKSFPRNSGVISGVFVEKEKLDFKMRAIEQSHTEIVCGTQCNTLNIYIFVAIVQVTP